MYKVLVTGNRGFIASRLENELVKMGCEVVGYDIKDGKDIRTMVADDLDDIEYVFHTAAQARVPLSIKDPVFTNDHNISGTVNVLKCAFDAGVKRVIYSASSSAYGNQTSLPLNEDMVPNPMSPYAIQKYVGELYCKNFYDLFGLETVCLRYFNVYGEDMPVDNPYSAAIGTFLERKKRNQKLSIFGGKQTRDFTYVGDVVRANIFAMLSENVGRGEVINIGSGSNYSIEEIALAVSDNVEYFQQRKGEPMNTKADNTKAKKLLYWQPSVDVIEWIRKQCVASQGVQ